MSAAHDTGIVVDGDLYYVRRSFALIRRLEQKLGPLAQAERKLRAFDVTGDELVAIYKLVLQDQESSPEDDVIRTHVFEGGIRPATEQLALLVLQLFAGNAQAVKWLEAEAARSREGEDRDPPRAA